MIYRDKENKGSITLTHRVKMFLKQYKKLVNLIESAGLWKKSGWLVCVFVDSWSVCSSVELINCSFTQIRKDKFIYVMHIQRKGNNVNPISYKSGFRQMSII
jgi:hypothetical protein